VKRLGRALFVLCLPAFSLVVAALFTPLPPELRAGSHRDESVRFLDRNGGLLREVRADDATRSRWVSWEDVGANVKMAILAAEDRRFDLHAGVDPFAVVRAVASSLWHRRLVSGASTITMQLARLVRPHRRDGVGKLGEMALALRIEASLSKHEILEQYLNRAPFGEGVRGIEAASRLYLDKPASELSLAEAAALAGIPRGPAVYSMTKHPERVLRRRDRILDRMLDAGWISADDATRAKREPLAVRMGKGSFGAPHLVEALRAGALRGAAPGAHVVKTTIDRDLQREAEASTLAILAPLASRDVTAASVVVLDNASGDILAYVGSPRFDDTLGGGQNDGVRALRQPGSTLKPFVYGLAMERLGMTPSTLLPDIELQLQLADGVFAPRDYDERFHGPVRLREALASSLNVPAVWTANEVGVAPLLERLHSFGLQSLDATADHYGPALALGDGEVTLLELADAYAALARGGVWKAVRAVDESPPSDEGARVMPRAIADELADILSDHASRTAAFGEASSLDLPFPVAAKTGTSKGYRDNWTVGFTREVTVGVWVGNFDGRPMHGVSGITGAGPLFRAVMQAAMRGRSPAPLRAEQGGDDALVRVEVCPLSGGRPTHACTHVVDEWMTAAQASDLHACEMHETVRIDVRNGLRAGDACAPSFVIARPFERYEDRFAAWATSAGRVQAPSEWSPFCRASSRDSIVGALRIDAPIDGSRYFVEPGRLRSDQTLRVRIAAPPGTPSVDLVVDGRVAARVGAPYVASWLLAPGEHTFSVVAPHQAPSEPVHVAVE
jgi:penicillin-binding protein 1C